LVASVVIHAICSGYHGYVHTRIPVDLTLFQTLYVVFVVGLLPFLGWFFLSTRRELGAALIAFSMLGSLIFGFCYHFIIINQVDHVFEVPISSPYRISFLVTSVMLVVTDTTGTVLGLVAFLTKGPQQK